MSHDPRADGDEASRAKVQQMLKNPRAEQRVAEQAGKSPETLSGHGARKPDFLSDTAYARALRVVGAESDKESGEKETLPGVVASAEANAARGALVARPPSVEDAPTHVAQRVRIKAGLQAALADADAEKRLPAGRPNDPTFAEGLSRAEHDAVREELDEKRSVVAGLAVYGHEPVDRPEDLEPMAQALVDRKGVKGLARPPQGMLPEPADAASTPSPMRWRLWLLVAVAIGVLAALAIAWMQSGDVPPEPTNDPIRTTTPPTATTTELPSSIASPPVAETSAPPTRSAKPPAPRPKTSATPPAPSPSPAPTPSASTAPKWGELKGL